MEKALYETFDEQDNLKRGYEMRLARLELSIGQVPIRNNPKSIFSHLFANALSLDCVDVQAVL